jgi:predicted DCC family thiol-disulfide oxidoreductase YuxK
MTTSYVVRAMELGNDLKGLPRGLFFYDGGCGVCKFTVSIVAHYDKYDHIRYRPLQTSMNHTIEDDVQMKELYLELGIKPFDLSTAVLLDGINNRIYTKSEAILYLLPHMGFPFAMIGPLLLLLFPKFIRDFGYDMFAKYRSTIWIYIKRMTGLGDTCLYEYRSKIILPKKYINDPTFIPTSWGLDEPTIPIVETMTNETTNIASVSSESKKES